MINPSIKYPDSLLKYLGKKELEIICKIFNAKNLETIDIEKVLSKKILPINGFLQKELSYNEILDKILLQFKISFNLKDSIQTKEEKILSYKFNQVINNLSPEEKEKIDQKIIEYCSQNGIDRNQIVSLNALSTLTLANASGFGLYLMSSTLVGGLTSILGITLPFTFYTGMSSALSFVTGPVGWAIGFGYLAYSFRNDSFQSASQKIMEAMKIAKNTLTGSREQPMMIICFLASCRIILKEENLNKKNILLKEKEEIKKDISNLKELNRDLDKQIYLLKSQIQINDKNINNLDEKSFEIDVNLKKIQSFINQNLN